MGLCYTALYNNTALSVFSPLSRISHRLLFTISNLFRNAVWKFQDWHLKKLMIKLPVNCRSQSKTTVLHASWLFDLWPTCLLIISNLSIFTFALVHFQIENWRIVLKKMDMCQINQYLHGSQTFSRQGPLKWHKPMTSNSHVFCNCVSYGWNYRENTFLQTSLWEPLHVLKCLHPAPVGFILKVHFQSFRPIWACWRLDVRTVRTVPPCSGKSWDNRTWDDFIDTLRRLA